MKIKYEQPPGPAWHYEAKVISGRYDGELHVGIVHAETEAEALEEAKDDAWDWPFRQYFCSEGDEGRFDTEVIVTVKAVSNENSSGSQA